MESPEKITSLDRQKKPTPLLNAINDLEQTVYGGTDSYGQRNLGSGLYGTTGSYNQPLPQSGYNNSLKQDIYNQAKGSPKLNVSSTSAGSISPLLKTPIYSTSFQSPSSSTPGQHASLNATKPHETSFNSSPKAFSSSPQPPPHQPYSETYLRSDQKSSPQPIYQTPREVFLRSEHKPTHFDGYSTTDTTTRTFKSPALTTFEKPDYKSGSDGYTSSEYTTNVHKTPEGYKTDSYKYEYYQSEPKTTYSSTSEKFYTTTTTKDAKGNIIDDSAASLIPKGTFHTFNNGGGDEQYQSSYSTNVEYINEPPILKDNDTLEQKMLKKSISEQIFEKNTTTTSRTTKQESQMKTFKFQ